MKITYKSYHIFEIHKSYLIIKICKWFWLEFHELKVYKIHICIKKGIKTFLENK